MTSTTFRATRAIHPGAAPLRLARGVWLPGDVDDDAPTQLRRFAETLPLHSVVVERSAALLLELWLPHDNRPLRCEFASTAPGRGRDMQRTRRPELQGSRRQFTAGDVVWVDGIAVSSPAQTWFDLARRLRLAELVALGDSVLRSGTTVDELAALVARYGRRRGVVNARAALPLLDARSRSRPESHLRVELTVPGWPRFEANAAIHDQHGGWLAEPDLSNEEYAVAVEYQGGWHSDDTRMRKDLTRGVTVVGEQWQILPVGPAEVFTHPQRLRTAVAEMLRRAGWPGPRGATPRVASFASSGRV